MACRTIASISLVVLLLGTGLTGQSTSPGQLDFLGVTPPRDDDYRKADLSLKNYLSNELRQVIPGFSLDYKKFDNYGEEILEVTARQDRPYLARMTPYAYVTAWMLGADFDVLATYQSKATSSTTYRAYFVVNHSRFGDGPANLDTLRDYLKGHRRPIFMFHDQFSTSSYFLPVMWLRHQLIFDMPASSGALTAIESRFNPDGSSLDSVLAVARGEVDIAAVWDGTKKKLADDPNLRYHLAEVIFIPLPDPLPNDLLVASNRLDVAERKAVLAAIAAMKGKTAGEAFMPFGDFTSWTTIQDAPDARQALANLRQLASAPPASVVVDVRAPDAFQSAVRKAVRLSYPEYVLFDPDFHATWDVAWTIRPIHDGAVELTSELNGSDVSGYAQQFPISYVSIGGDLTTRIMALIHTRMHRLRYVWPYQDQEPTILGDVDFTVAPGSRVRIQRLTWVDPQRNDFTLGNTRFASVESADAFKTKLKLDSLPAGSNGKADFNNPLSNVGYRVLLVRPSYESTTTRVITLALIVLFIGAAVGAGFDLRRKPATPGSATPLTFDQECRLLALSTLTMWRRALDDTDVIWCDRRQLEEKIAELKTKGVVSYSLGGVERHSQNLSGGFKASPFKWLPFGFAVDWGQYRDLVIDPAKVGDTARLSALLGLLVEKDQLSAFVGRPVEWDAMSHVVARALGAPDCSGDAALAASGEAVSNLASRHFASVLADLRSNWSLFRATWTVSTPGDQSIATAIVPLPGVIEIGKEKTRVSALRLELEVPSKVNLPASACWVLGKMLKVDAARDGTETALKLRFGPIAFLVDVSPSASSAGTKE